MAFWLSFFVTLLTATAEEPQTLLSASQVNQLAQGSVREFVSLRLQGVVCGIDRAHQSLLLKDDSGFVWLEEVPLPDSIGPGASVIVEGLAAAGNRRVVFRPMPIADQNWVFGKIEQAARIQLQAGRHPFELHYLQTSAGTNLLDVTCNSLGLSSNSFPADLFLCPSPAAPESLVGGLRYECYRGGQHVQLPAFKPLGAGPGLKPEDGYAAAILASGAELAGSGVATNISLLLAGRETNCILRFYGWFQAPTNGAYQFSVAADDAARLLLPYDASCRIESAGQASLPEARLTVPGQAWVDGVESYWAEAEGVVKRAGSHDGSLVLELFSERAGHMTVTVADGGSVEPAILLNSRISARGLCRSVMTPGGSRLAGELFVPSTAEINFLHASEVLWLDYPATTISNLAHLQLSNLAGGIVHLQGAAEVEDGRLTALEDATGRMQVQPLPQAPVDPGAPVEMLGFLARQGDRLVLTSAVCRQLSNLSSEKTLPTLTTIEQVRRLKPEQAALRYPVRIRGVVLFTFSGGTRADVQGESESIYVSGTSSARQALEVGKLYEFDGTANSGAFSPTITYRSATLLGSGNIPEPLHPNWSQLINGSLDAQWVEVEGIVLRVSGPDMAIGTRRGPVTAKFFHDDTADLTRYLDAVVRVRGTVRAVANRQRQLQSVYVKVPSPAQVIVDQHAPADPFSAPNKRVSELREFDPNAAFFQRIRTTGQVMHVRDGVGYLMDGTNGMRFVPRENTTVSPGDLVEVVGFPDLEGPSPVMQQALVRVFNRSSLPPAHMVAANELLSTANDSTRVRFDANLLNIRTNLNEQVLELQTGQHVFQARLDRESGLLPSMPVGSSLTLTGTYVGQGLRSAGSATVQSFELLLNSPADIAVLDRPTWWTPRRAFAVVGGMAFVLALAAVWITLLRRQVESRTQALRGEIDRHKQTEAKLEVKTQNLEQEIRQRTGFQSELEDKKNRLESEIEERKRIELEVAKTHRQLVDMSRKAGQAEVASSILHNVGNVLNSVNVSASLVHDRLYKMRLANVNKVASLMQANSDNLGVWMAEDPRGRQLPAYIESLGKQLEDEQKTILKEVTSLVQNVEHIKEIVSMQQNYARVAGVSETIAVSELVENALKMEAGGYTRHGIELVRDYAEVPMISVDKHRVLQILVNLFHNSKYACDEAQRPDKRVQVRIRPSGEDRVRIEVADNGVGITPENMKRIFSHGFTTRKNGHGFGLHSSVLAAKEIGGMLTAHSDGPGMGALFVLELPRNTAPNA